MRGDGNADDGRDVSEAEDQRLKSLLAALLVEIKATPLPHKIAELADELQALVDAKHGVMAAPGLPASDKTDPTI